jgi:hypothetical protein
MRFICYILSIYFMMLISVPCADNLYGSHSTETEMGSPTNGNHQHNNGDQCSPFCTCNCCTSPVIQQEFIIQFDKFALLQEYPVPEYVSAITSNYLTSIWQPPQQG